MAERVIDKLRGRLHEGHFSNEIILIAMIIHSGVGWPWLLSVLSF